MQTSSRLRRPVAAMFACAALWLLASYASAATKWDLTSAWPPGNFHVENAERFAAAVSEATGGEVEIAVHPGAALGIKGPEALVAVSDGIVHMADIQMNQQVGEHPFWGIESLPFLATGYMELRLLQHFTRPVFEELAREYNQKILYVVPWPGQKVWANRAVDQSVEQFEGMKIRTIDKNATDFFDRLGAAPIQMPWGEVIPALASGTITAVSTSSSSAVDGKFWEFMSHGNLLDWQMNSQMVSVNLDAWNSVDEQTRQVIERVARELEPEFWMVSYEEDAQNLELLNDEGPTLVRPTPALKAELAEVAAGMWEEYLETAGPEAKEVLDQYRKIAGK